MKMAAIRVVLFVIACWIVGCGGEAPSVETSIGEDGGDIELGSVTLTIAPDLLPVPVTVSIKQRWSEISVLMAIRRSARPMSSRFRSVRPCPSVWR